MSRSESSNPSLRRLQSVVNHTADLSGPGAETFILVLPDGGKVTASLATGAEGLNEIFLNGTPILNYTISNTHELVFDISSIGTRYQGVTTHIPKYKLLTLSAPTKSSSSRVKEVTISDLWVAIYALFTRYHEQEHIPFLFAPPPTFNIQNIQTLTTYLINSGLARTYPTSELVPQKPQQELIRSTLFLSRAAFWQGAGTAGYHNRSWLLRQVPIFPYIPAYTRSEKVIAMHPLRPAKPNPGEILYRRWSGDVNSMVEFAYFDIDGVYDGSAYPISNEGGAPVISRHMAAFHRWHNDERVNSAWGEQGSLETHREYVKSVLADPHVWPCMVSWDGELMGYCEIVYVKEDHVAQHFPLEDVVPGDWERGIHVLVGENKFLGGGRASSWIRSLVHLIFLMDPRTVRVVGEPNHENAAIAIVAGQAGFHVVNKIDFPYKRSLLLLNPRDKFFKLCTLR
ncbi:acyl-CoA N-acyltransferase [Panaeolus papilionaceus]|nr:acyl-CoA N-acyltransferase [Panaeolus papilionaceus]